MRKAKCDCCQRADDWAPWYVFESVRICETCRLAVVDWMLTVGFSFAHPFVIEFSNVEK